MLRDKLGTKATKTLDLAIQSDKEYRIALEKTNERQNRYYEKEMPSILEVIPQFPALYHSLFLFRCRIVQPLETNIRCQKYSFPAIQP